MAERQRGHRIQAARPGRGRAAEPADRGARRLRRRRDLRRSAPLRQAHRTRSSPRSRGATSRSRPTASPSTSIPITTAAAATTSWSTPPAPCSTARSPTTAGRTLPGTACGSAARSATSRAGRRRCGFRTRSSASSAAPRRVGGQLPSRDPAPQRGELPRLSSPRRRADSSPAFPSSIGIEDVQPSRSIELLPYVTTKAEYLRHAPLDPFNDGTDSTPTAASTCAWAVGSRLTLNATVNPDFGQVEVDPAVVNLSDVESFFDEKRPFFVEGSSNFSFGSEGANGYWGFNWPQPTFFYSRRIGRAPRTAGRSLDPDDVGQADYVDAPIGTTILGAAKLTGKLSPSWNFGTLHALTASEIGGPHGRRGALRCPRSSRSPTTAWRAGCGVQGSPPGARDAHAPWSSRSFDESAPRGRAQRRCRHHRPRRMDLPRQADRPGWSPDGPALSHVRGHRDAHHQLQRDPRHYFQRPDADHIEVDPDATSLTGYASRFWLNKQKGSTFMNAALGFMTPEIRGQRHRLQVARRPHQRPRRLRLQVDRDHQAPQVPGRPRRRVLELRLPGQSGLGRLLRRGQHRVQQQLHLELPHRVQPADREHPAHPRRPAHHEPAGLRVRHLLRHRQQVEALLLARYRTPTCTEAGYSEWAAFPAVEWKPVSNVLFRVGPGFERLYENAQYVDTHRGSICHRDLRQPLRVRGPRPDTVSAQVRLNWAFTPNLSLQTFLQPLISTGDYNGFKSLARPRSYAFDPYAYRRRIPTSTSSRCAGTR